MSDEDKEKIKKARSELVVKGDDDWDIDKWDGELSETDAQLLKKLGIDLNSKSSSSKGATVDPSKLSDADKELIKKLRIQMTGKKDDDWDINEWDGKLSEGDVKLLKQMNKAMGNKSDLSFLGEDEEEGEWDGKLSDADIDNLAKEVIRGNFGSGEQRKELLGEYYQDVQNKVNQLMSSYTSSNSTIGSTTVKDVPKDTVKAGSRIIGSIVSKAIQSNLNNKPKKK